MAKPRQKISGASLIEHTTEASVGYDAEASTMENENRTILREIGNHYNALETRTHLLENDRDQLRAWIQVLESDRDQLRDQMRDLKNDHSQQFNALKAEIHEVKEKRRQGRPQGLAGTSSRRESLNGNIDDTINKLNIAHTSADSLLKKYKTIEHLEFSHTEQMAAMEADADNLRLELGKTGEELQTLSEKARECADIVSTYKNTSFHQPHASHEECTPRVQTELCETFPSADGQEQSGIIKRALPSHVPDLDQKHGVPNHLALPTPETPNAPFESTSPVNTAAGSSSAGRESTPEPCSNRDPAAATARQAEGPDHSDTTRGSTGVLPSTEQAEVSVSPLRTRLVAATNALHEVTRSPGIRSNVNGTTKRPLFPFKEQSRHDQPSKSSSPVTAPPTPQHATAAPETPPPQTATRPCVLDIADDSDSDSDSDSDQGTRRICLRSAKRLKRVIDDDDDDEDSECSPVPFSEEDVQRAGVPIPGERRSDRTRRAPKAVLGTISWREAQERGLW